MLESNSFYPSIGKRFNITIHDLILKIAGKSPDAIVISAPGRKDLTYSQLSKQITYVIKFLNDYGINRGDPVAVVLPNGPDIATTFLTIASGAIFAPLNPNYKTKEFDFFLSDLNAKAVIIQSGMKSQAISVARQKKIQIIQLSPLEMAGIFSLDGEKKKKITTNNNGDFAQTEDIALILHTSGTTSRPKIVPLMNTNICTSANNIRLTLKLNTSDCCLNIMPLFHIHGLIGAILSSVLAGARIVCTPGFYPLKFFDWVERYQPTWYTAVPTMHQSILECMTENTEIIKRSRFRFIRSSSSALAPQVMEALEKMFNAPVIESYGMTEASHQMASNKLPPEKRKAGTVGIASGPEIAIMDQKGKFLPRGIKGEIVIKGKNVIEKYQNNPEANKKSFTNGWFRTGDQGYFDEDNYLKITDRLKEIINRGGEKISPREVDEVLLSHPSISQAVSFAIPHPKLGEEIGAVIVLRNNAVITEWDIQKFVASQITDFKIPRHILILDKIPKGPTGKVQRISLADKLGISNIYEDDDFRTNYQAPKTPLEEKIAEIWSKILEIDKIGTNDNYFQLGGDSIQGRIILLLLSKELQINEIPLVIFLHGPTIEKMARIISKKEFLLTPASLIAIQINGSKPPFYCVHACGGDVLFLTDLVNHLDPEQPFYALRAQGLDENTTPYTRVEDMAAHYLTEIQAIQPEGPYFLGGAGVGGIIAMEMSQQLISRGENVRLLAMMDTILPRPIQSLEPKPSSSRVNFLDFIKDFKYSLHQINYYIENREFFDILRRILVEIVFPRLRKNKKIKRKKRKIERRIAEMGINQFNVFEKTRSAVDKYIVKEYSGPILLLVPEKRGDTPGVPQDRIHPWYKFTTDPLYAHVIPGVHLNILKPPNVHILAQKLKYYLDQAFMGNVG